MDIIDGIYRPTEQAMSVLEEWFQVSGLHYDSEVLSFKAGMGGDDRLEFDVANQMPVDDFADFANLIEVNYQASHEPCYDSMQFTTFVASKTGISTLREQLERL